jgi:hypothetical protein
MTITYVDGCVECEGAKARSEAPVPPHFNCLYKGQAAGHRAAGHCTANACY